MIDITIPTIGAALGICGAIFNSFQNNRYKLFGFAVWLGSNGLLIYWAYTVQQFEIMVMYCVYFGTATIGIYNHWKPGEKGDFIMKLTDEDWNSDKTEYYVAIIDIIIFFTAIFTIILTGVLAFVFTTITYIHGIIIIYSALLAILVMNTKPIRFIGAVWHHYKNPEKKEEKV